MQRLTGEHTNSKFKAARHTLQDVFRSVSPETPDAFAASSTLLHLCKGQKLFAVGETPRAVYVVTQGCLKVVCEGPEGESTITGLIRSGDVIGIREVCLESRYSRTSVALLDTIVCALDAQTVVARVKRDPLLGEYFMRFFAGELIRLERRLDDRLHTSAYARVARIMAQLYEMFGTGDEPVFHLPLNRRDIAELADVTPETVSRALSELKHSGVLQASGATFRVLDGGALRAAAE